MIIPIDNVYHQHSGARRARRSLVHRPVLPLRAVGAMRQNEATMRLTPGVCGTVWAVVTACTASGAWAAAQAPRTLCADDFYRSAQLSEPAVSPDGAWVAYVVTSNDRDKDEPRSAVWMVSWDGKQRLALSNPASGTHAPRWSPDGRYLSFLSSAGDAAGEVLMLLDRRGGEARSVYLAKGAVGDYRWSPDGSRLVLALKTASDAEKTPHPIVVDDLHFKQDEDGYLGVGSGGHLFLFDLAAEKAVALTDDAASDDELPAWSPDGRQIAFVRTHSPGVDPDGREDIEVIDVPAAVSAGETAPQAAPHLLVRPFAPNAQQLAWSPDGRFVAYLQGLAPKLNAYIQDRLAVVGAAGGAPRALSDPLDRAITSYVFTADSAALLATIEDDGSVYPVRLSLADGSVQRLVPGAFVVSDLTTAVGHTALLYSNDGAAAEIYALEDGALRKLTDHNDALFAELRLGAVQELRFKSRDGTEVHGFAVLPPDYVPGRRYPTILWIHGGPNGQDDHSVDFDAYNFRRQMLAATGYVVLGINYRGSSGRGHAYAQAILADWGHKEVEDLLAGVDAAVERGLADPAHLGIGGWSYGGILTDYTIASDHRFQAAASGAGSANQLSMYGADQYILQYNAELGFPWRDTALWLKVSYPFFHADRIHTPTLFMGGTKDFNVPVAGAEQMFEALRTLGVPTELVIYPGESHGLRRPSFLVDRVQRVTAWFDRYLRGVPANAPGSTAAAAP
jgi:dipeptidyl aminopeptidase/acylaminoacyl peptidase